MIEFRTGNILQADTEALVNTVNCVGFMGRGIALAFKEAYPENFKVYERACKHGEVVPGRMLVVDTGVLTNPRWIINFPTKRHWRGKSRIEDIVSGLEALVEAVETHGIRSIAIPPLGCGLGGLDWGEVRPLVERAVARMPGVDAVIYEPGGAPSQTMATEGKPPAMTTARAVLVLAMRRYLEAMLDPSVSLLELHKLMYFIQLAGKPVKLQYGKGHYGPYSSNLRFLLQSMNHYYIEADLTQGDQPTVPVQLVPSAEEEAQALIASDEASRQALDKVFQLIDGWESPHGLELLATVSWLCNEEKVRGLPNIVESTYRWSDRKRRFTPRQIALAHEVLRSNGWLSPPAGDSRPAT
jgi:O-acetyl-ADP-ribose deacetylase (regulator of RNase III)